MRDQSVELRTHLVPLGPMLEGARRRYVEFTSYAEERDVTRMFDTM